MQLSDFSPTKPSLEQSGLILQADDMYADIAEQILNEIKPSAHRTAALRLLLESKMALIHGITHPQP